MILNIINHSFHYEMEKLTRVFFPYEELKVLHGKEETGNYINTLRVKSFGKDIISVKVHINSFEREKSDEVELCESFDNQCERRMAVLLFDLLSEVTGYIPPWGILTGVRPSKLMCKYIGEKGTEEAKNTFIRELKVSPEKTSLALTVAQNEQAIMDRSRPESFSLYISVPFCPTRCSYCSFVSQANDQAKKLIPEYVEKLCEEIRITGEKVSKLGLRLESVYYGGGTPTTLSAEQYTKISTALKESFDLSACTEYTVEAGRPDTVTDEKMEALKSSSVTRISINPQTFNDSVLEKIGRKHTGDDAARAYRTARSHGFNNINMDLIAGLPSDTLESFKNTLDRVLELDPESVTVHTLALKRSSTIVTDSLETNDAELCKKMLEAASEKLKNRYIPYYMYRQSKCLGNLENVGWAKKGYECLYNVYMMEECHTVIALGAGAVTKLKAPHGDEIERVYNHKYPYEYIGRFDEIIERKEKIIEFYTKHSK